MMERAEGTRDGGDAADSGRGMQGGLRIRPGDRELDGSLTGDIKRGERKKYRRYLQTRRRVARRNADNASRTHYTYSKPSRLRWPSTGCARKSRLIA